MYNDKDLTEHEDHVGAFTADCDYCDIAKDFGFWQSGEFVTFRELVNEQE